ncbi:adenosine deaminase [Streptomyces sp. NPDC001406]|uniref:adenosine deaminase family protein n=1 Tax=Streptomyces sp. NPDC001406 TaxID=3364572 RepID=UPI0036AC5A8D
MNRHRALLPVGLGTVALAALLAPLSAAPAAARPTTARVDLPPPPRPVTVGEFRTDAYLRSIDGNPGLQRDFFRHLPKGADLHNHLSGAVATEYLLQLAAEDGLCIDTATMTAVQPPCGPGTRPAADTRTDPAFRQAVIRAWSMQDFPPDQSGHDHFFATFGKFGAVTGNHRGKQLAQVAEGIVDQNQFYLETMVTPASDGARRLAAEVGWDSDLARLHSKLVAGGKLDKVVADARKEADDADAEFRAEERCGTHRPRPGCRLTVRWISQVSRGTAPERVFTQIALGMRLAERDGRFVAINLVQPEDGEIALRDYSLQMHMIAYLRTQYPHAHVTLHAGELRPGLVKPEDLTFHIDEAVNVAHAERIGHGVDFVHENDWQALGRTMAARQVAVEVPFSSNAQILGIKGAEHPFQTYRAYGVPIVLATDDPGVSRIDISHEYQYAHDTYALSYPRLKDVARASIQYAFLRGAGLWRGNPTAIGYHPVAACQGDVLGAPVPSRRCRDLLASSPKAAVEWRQEAAFASFERAFRRNGA